MISPFFQRQRLGYLLRLFDPDYRRGQPVSVTRIARALRALERVVAEHDAAQSAEQHEQRQAPSGRMCGVERGQLERQRRAP